MKKYYIIACHVLWRELTALASQQSNIYNFTFLPQGLHNTPEVLRKKVQETIDTVSEDYDAILIGYGLCSNGILGIESRSIPLVLMRGHDCITFLLGSHQQYLDIFEKNPGTYWYSPGWIETGYVPSLEAMEQKRKDFLEKFGKDNADYLMDMEWQGLRNYNQAIWIDWGMDFVESYKEFTRKTAQDFGWKFLSQVGDTQLMKDFLCGHWDDDRFITVPPGYKISPTYDDTLLKLEPIDPTTDCD